MVSGNHPQMVSFFYRIFCPDFIQQTHLLHGKFGILHDMGLYKQPVSFKCLQIMLFFVLRLSFSQVVGFLYYRNMFFRCESILGRKSPNVSKCHFFRSFPFIAFHFAFISLNVSLILHSSPFILHSCPFIFPSCCSHFSFMSFHVPFIRGSFHIAFVSLHIPFISLSFYIHFLPCSVAMYQTYRSSKGNIFKPVRWVSAQTLACFSYFVIVFAIVMLSFWRPVQVAISRVHEHVQVKKRVSSLSFFYSYLLSFSEPVMHW